MGWKPPSVRSVSPITSALALLLFGSRARGDAHERSDLDLLMVTDAGDTWHSRRENLSVSCYSLEVLKKQAQNGSLFVCHIAFEAKPLFDPAGILGQIQQNFTPKSDYTHDLSHAGDLGWYLVHFGSTFDRKSLIRRMTWCTRTILIARSAEAGRPVFAPRLLAEQSKSDFVYKLLVDSRQKEGVDTSLVLFRSFLEAQSLLEPPLGKVSESQFLRLFRKTGNEVALRTMEQSQSRSNEAYL
jgi:hypothetical protein